MYTSMWRWLDDSIQSVQRSERVGPLELPNPSDPATTLSVGVCDPTTVAVIVGYALIRGWDATGAYVGLVGQDPTTRWRGLTGFFVSWCPGCDRRGDATLKALVQALELHGVSMKSIWELPPALHPQRGWFDGSEDGDRLLYGGYVAPDSHLEETWVPLGEAHEGPLLIATGPCSAGLGNVVLIDGSERERQELIRLRGVPSAWTQRAGTREALMRVAQIADVDVEITERRARSIGRLPSAWGAFQSRSGEWVGPVPNLRAELMSGDPEPADGIVVRYLPEGRAVRLSDIHRLAPVS